MGSIVFSAAIALFIDNLSLAPGGVGGIAILLNRLFPFLDTGAWILLLNVPLLIIGLIMFGKRFLVSTVYTTVFSSIFVDIIGKYAKPHLPLTDNIMLGAMAGGALLALGIGIVFRSGGTTGGMDIVVKLLRRRFRHMGTATIYMFTDVAVVLLAIPVMRNIESAMYSAVSLVVTNIILDKVLYGGEGGTLFYIVTETPDAIAKRILDEVELGVTYLHGEGAYTGAPKRVILCVAR
ncbi:MAG: YitT family protein, partial [Clostridia bacterium]|nr:YitT family protein [Clostridia bacterium]